MGSETTVWMISGNKGGVGKSLFCLALASALEMRGERYAILDGDGRTGDVFQAFQRKCPARSADFRSLRPESHMCAQDAEYEKILEDLLRASPNLIVNTPDGADQILMKWFDVTLSHTESNNCLFKFIYLMSDRPDGLDLLPSLAMRFSYLYPVRNLHFGNEALFEGFNRDYTNMFRGVVDFPVLRGEETRMLFNLKTYPAEAIQLKGASGAYALPSLSRARLIAWLGAVEDGIGNVIDNKDRSNIRDHSTCD